MSNKKNTTAWIIRIIIFALFLVSAVAKMYKSIVPLEPSIWGFEKQLVDLGLCGWCSAHYLARIIIGVELALAFAILQPHLLKKVVIPATIALLAAFCIHLGIQMAEFGVFADGNCGCFGELIPMTPFEAFLKNVFSIGLLVWLYKLLPSKNESWSKLINGLAILLTCLLFMFIAFPFCPCGKDKTATKDLQAQVLTDTAQVVQQQTQSLDSLNQAIASDSLISENEKQRIQDSLTQAKQKLEAEETARKKAEEKRLKKEAEAAKVAMAKGPKAVVSKYAQFPVFSGKKEKIDVGKKTICLFAPGCDHCQNTCKELGKLAKEGKTPPVLIYFMDEEAEKIPEFFKIAGVTYPYQVLGIGDFWDLLGDGSTPGVIGLWNGNVQQSYEGINENEFDLQKFKKFALPKE